MVVWGEESQVVVGGMSVWGQGVLLEFCKHETQS